MDDLTLDVRTMPHALATARQRREASRAARIARGEQPEAEVGPIEPFPTQTVEDRGDWEARQTRLYEGRRARWERRLPTRWRNASLGLLAGEQDPAGAVSGWWPSGHATLILWAPTPGVGKTFAGYAVGAQAAVEDGAVVEVWTATELLDALRPAGDREAVLERVTGADLFVLDDLGRETSDKDWVREQWHLIFNARYANRLRNVVTMNLTGAQLTARYDATLVNRLVDDAIIVEVKGQTRRHAATWGA